MFGNCFCGRTKPKTARGALALISQKERELLRLIFDDLASRSPNKKLTQQNFILFFSLTGLWGDKLFKCFTSNGKEEIDESEFLQGMAKTVRAETSQKIRLLFDFIKDPKSQGIKYKQLLKMMYHYSKPELKQIMTNDGVFVHEAIIPPTEELTQQKRNRKKGDVVHLDRPYEKQTSIESDRGQIFAKAHEEIMKYRDPGTQIMFHTEKLTYKVSYCNMGNLTKQFTSHIFKNFDIDEKTGSMSLEQFSKYFSSNKTLFNTYFKAFHENLWGAADGSPNFLKNVEKEGTVFVLSGKVKQPAHLMLSCNALFFAVSSNRKEEVFKIILMEGILVKRVSDMNLVIKDSPNELSTVEVKFEEKQEADSWMDNLKDFEKNYIKTKYQILEPVGTGRFSVVYRGLEQSTNRQVAIKMMELDKLDEASKRSIEHETEVMKVLKSQWVIKHYETVFSRHIVYMVTEYIYGEDLFEYVKKSKRLSEKEAALLLFQIILAVMDIHSMEIIHRDLKPENIMVVYKRGDALTDSGSSNGGKLSANKLVKPVPETIKLIDFGFANYYSILAAQQKPPQVGTPNYISPEILLGKKPSFQNDTFAVGSILYFMLRGKYAFDSPYCEGTAIKTVTGDYTMCDEVWEQISSEAKDLIEMLLQVNPEDRITLKEALEHPWFNEASTSDPCS